MAGAQEVVDTDIVLFVSSLPYAFIMAGRFRRMYNWQWQLSTIVNRHRGQY